MLLIICTLLLSSIFTHCFVLFSDIADYIYDFVKLVLLVLIEILGGWMLELYK